MTCEVWIEILSWPAEADRLALAQDAGRPALLLVEPGQDPPSMINPLLDWVRAPAEESEVELRLQNLGQRLTHQTSFETDLPVLEDHVVRYGSSVVILSPVEAQLMSRLLDHGRAVVSREELVEAAWEGEEPDRNTVDVAMGRLRRKVEPVGITIRTIRSRGFLLELENLSGSSQEPVRKL